MPEVYETFTPPLFRSCSIQQMLMKLLLLLIPKLPPGEGGRSRRRWRQREATTRVEWNENWRSDLNFCSSCRRRRRLIPDLRFLFVYSGMNSWYILLRWLSPTTLGRLCLGVCAKPFASFYEFCVCFCEHSWKYIWIAITLNYMFSCAKERAKTQRCSSSLSCSS